MSGLSRRAFVSGLASSALTFGGCAYILGRDAGTYRFRLTTAVETPQGPRTGSTVLSTSYSLQSGFMSNYSARADAQLHGQAAVIDLGQGRYLFMLLAHGATGENVDQIGYLPTSALLGLYGWDAVQALLAGRRLDGSAPLRPPLIPTLVTFRDLNDPASARVVEPTDAGFAAAFGPGFRLASVTLEMVPVGVWPLNLVGITGTPVTRGIEVKVPWINDAAQRVAAVRGMFRSNNESGGPNWSPDSMFKRK